MRIRRKPWARPELAAWENCIDNPAENKGKWAKCFKNNAPLMLELGCGKGTFIAKLASTNLDKNYIAVDIKSEMLGLAKRNIEKEYSQIGKEINNVLIFSQDIELISNVFAPEDCFDRIYINFCNPWPKTHDHKKRLTHIRQLIQYRSFLKDEGEIHFKTDNDDLFLASQRYFEECGFDIVYLTEDLHSSGYEGNIVTEHEQMFSNDGIKIKFLIAKKKDLDEEIVNELKKSKKIAKTT